MHQKKGQSMSPKELDQELWAAVENCMESAEKIQTLLKQGANVHMHSEKGEGLLHILNLYTRTRVDKIRVLIQHGIDVNSVDQWGKTLLHKECMNECCPQVVELLLDSGANFLIRDAKGKSALYWATATAYTQKKALQVMKLLLQKGAHDNEIVAEKQILLHKAVIYESNPEVLRLLIEYGADPWHKDNHGKIPLDYARDPFIASFLRQAMVEQERQRLQISESKHDEPRTQILRHHRL